LELTFSFKAFGKQLFWDWKYDQILYEDLPEHIQKWEKDKMRFLGYINPFLELKVSFVRKQVKKVVP